MTLLSPPDAQKLGITDDMTYATSVFTGVGGEILVPTILARITLADESSDRTVEIATHIGLLGRVIEGMPSLLGMDVLQHFDVRFPAA
jgi:predicted aspartyl protease